MHNSINNGHIIVKSGEREYTLSPTFAHIDRIGDPADVVEHYAMLYSPSAKAAIRTAAAVILSCCDEDCTDLTGHLDERLDYVAGEMPASEMLIIARHLMQHGTIGGAKVGTSSGEFTREFNSSEFVDAAVIHFGISHAEAWQLTMTQFTRMLDMKYPEAAKKRESEITPEKYDKAVADFESLRAKRLARAAANGN